MESLAPLAEFVPALGAAVLLGTLLLRFWRQSSADRAAHTREVAQRELQHAEYVKHIVEQHGAEVARLREEINDMVSTKAQLRANLERERELRWQAQEELARLRRRLSPDDPEPQP